MRLHGIHHVTAITADGPRNAEFYGGVLGLRLVTGGFDCEVPMLRGSHCKNAFKFI